MSGPARLAVLAQATAQSYSHRSRVLRRHQESALVPILRNVLGKVPSNSKARVRNFIANSELGTQSDIHENVISPGVIVPWHYHETEEVIIVLEGHGECRTENGTESYEAG